MKLNAAGVGIRIKQARVAKGWTQAQLAKQLGVQRSSVVRWETGISVPQRIPELATLLGQSASWLLDKAAEAPAAVGQIGEVARLSRELRRLQKQKAPTPVPTQVQIQVNGNNNPPVVVSQVNPQFTKDEAVLQDVLRTWNRVNSETRLMVALLMTGDWSYKLKLWNMNIAVGEELLKTIGDAHNNRHKQS